MTSWLAAPTFTSSSSSFSLSLSISFLLSSVLLSRCNGNNTAQHLFPSPPFHISQCILPGILFPQNSQFSLACSLSTSIPLHLTGEVTHSANDDVNANVTDRIESLSPSSSYLVSLACKSQACRGEREGDEENMKLENSSYIMFPKRNDHSQLLISSHPQYSSYRLRNQPVTTATTIA